MALAAFEQAFAREYTMARGGSGSYDRHIAPGLLAPLLKAMQARGRVPAAVRADLLRPPRVNTRTHTPRPVHALTPLPPISTPLARTHKIFNL